MPLDLGTLYLVTTFVTALVGALLLFSWWQNREVGALAFWGASLVMGALGTLLFIQRGSWSGVLTNCPLDQSLFGIPARGALYHLPRYPASSSVRPAIVV